MLGQGSGCSPGNVRRGFDLILTVWKIIDQKKYDWSGITNSMDNQCSKEVQLNWDN